MGPTQRLTKMGRFEIGSKTKTNNSTDPNRLLKNVTKNPLFYRCATENYLVNCLYLILLGASMAGYSLASSNILNIKVMDDLLMLVRLLLFFYMIYHGIKQKLIYASDLTTFSRQTERPGKPEPVASNSEEKPVPESEHKETIMKLRKLMLEESLYLKQELSLGETANKLGIHAHQLSKLLNAQLQKSFFEFVNEYRVDEFKKLVSDPKNKHLSLLGLAMEAGFNSKATFNRFFKNSMGITPSEFRKSHQP